MSSKQIFTLEQVARSIKKTLSERYTQTYWVKAEMHKLNRFPSGHAFPELVQRDEQRIVAQMSATIWKQQLESINRAFIEVVKEPLKEGTNLLMQVKVVFSEIYGLSLQILTIDPSFSLGELQRERDETLKRLHAADLLNRNQLLLFPLLPKRIAIISADASKGLSDFMEVLLNEPRFVFQTTLFPAYLQGDVAVQSIIDALELVKGNIQNFDLVVIVRGGGSEVGMTCYNNYELCKSIATFPLPILTGIGHSTNMTVAEMVAFRNAITPTQLATLLVNAFFDFEHQLGLLLERIQDFSDALIVSGKRELMLLSTTIRQATNSRQQQAKFDLKRSEMRIKSDLQKFIATNQKDLMLFQKNLLQMVSDLIVYPKQQLQKIIYQITSSSQNQLQNGDFQIRRLSENTKVLSSEILLMNKNLLQHSEIKVEMLHPENVLKRGYAIVRKNGLTLSDMNSASSNDEVEIQTAYQELKARIL
ncbi:MAG: hypothetical protein RL264_115 [Bacteroidota bacterium]